MDYHETRQYLNQLKYINVSIRAKKEQLVRLRATAEKITPSLSLAPGGSGDTDFIGRAVEQIAELEQQLKASIAELISIQKCVTLNIESVEDERYRALLTSRYINGHTWESIAEEFELSGRWVRELDKEAVKALSEKIQCLKNYFSSSL